MNLSELKLESATTLAQLAGERGIEGMGGMAKQDVIFALLQAETRDNG